MKIEVTTNPDGTFNISVTNISIAEILALVKQFLTPATTTPA